MDNEYLGEAICDDCGREFGIWTWSNADDKRCPYCGYAKSDEG